MKYTLIGLAMLAALGTFYGLHRFALWAERRGWIYYLTKHGSSGALGNALLQAQAIIEPSTRHVLEERMKDDLEAEETGDPPDPGKGDAVQHGAPVDGPSAPSAEPGRSADRGDRNGASGRTDR